MNYGRWLDGLSHRQRPVLCLLHDFPFPRSLVVDTAEVQDAVYDDTVQLRVVVASEELRIRAHGIEADEEVTAEPVAFAVIEGDDVGVVIVLQILAVHLQNLLVGTENIGDFTGPFPVSGGYGLDPFRGLALFDGGHVHAVCLITDHG